MKNIIEAFIESLISLPRRGKQFIIFGVDIAMVSLAYIFALALVHNDLTRIINEISLLHYGFTVVFSILLLLILGFYKEVTRFISFKILVNVATGSALSGLVYYILGIVFNTTYSQVSSSIVFTALLCILLGGPRLLVRSYFSMRFNTQKGKVIIYGAGSAGRQLATSLINGNEYYPVAYIDDDVALENVIIQGIRVYSPEELKDLAARFKVEKVLLALPSISRAQRKHIINKVEKAGVAIQTIPGMSDIVAGKMKIDEFQDVEIEDLLGRDLVPPVQELLDKNIKDKIVLVTGAGGSIGSELCRQIILLKPSKLLLFEFSEFSLYGIDKNLGQIVKDEGLDVEIYPILGSVQNQKHLVKVLSHYGVQSLYHAAAYKHVPMVEYNIIEGVKNNILGTFNTALAAIESNVETFVLISTDKAVRPTNVMGATKRFSELILQSLALKQNKTRFCMVRFGNVLGSSGSVIPLFKKQIKSGGPVTVTHPDIIRYFMTIPEAAQLVIQAGAMGVGGDVFVLDMGEPVKIADLAKKLITLMGLEVRDERNPSGDVDVIYTGLRPGEKLYEELLIGKDVEGTNHPLIMTAKEKFMEWPQLIKYIDGLRGACNNFNHEKVRELLLDAPTDFNPSDKPYDLLAGTKAIKAADKVVELNSSGK